MEGLFGGNNSFVCIILLLCLCSGKGFGGFGCCDTKCDSFGGGFNGILPLLLLLFCCNGSGFGCGPACDHR